MSSKEQTYLVVCTSVNDEEYNLLFEIISNHYVSKKASDQIIFVLSTQSPKEIFDKLTSKFKIETGDILVVALDKFYGQLAEDVWEWIIEKDNGVKIE